MPYVSGVLVDGYPAALLGVALRDLARRGYFDRVPADARAELLATIADLEKAGRAWSQRAAGSSETARPEVVSPSVLSVDQAAALLGVSARRARQLAPSLGGRKTAGRWVFDRDAVAAERQRREGSTA